MLPQVQPLGRVSLPAHPAAVATVELPPSSVAERQLEHDWLERDYRRSSQPPRRHGIRRTRQCPRCRLFTVRAHCSHCGHVDTGTAA